MLRLSHDCHAARSEAASGSFAVVTTAYSYRILDLDERELLAFHWHPVGRSNVTTPTST